MHTHEHTFSIEAVPPIYKAFQEGLQSVGEGRCGQGIFATSTCTQASHHPLRGDIGIFRFGEWVLLELTVLKGLKLFQNYYFTNCNLPMNMPLYNFRVPPPKVNRNSSMHGVMTAAKKEQLPAKFTKVEGYYKFWSTNCTIVARLT